MSGRGAARARIGRAGPSPSEVVGGGPLTSYESEARNISGARIAGGKGPEEAPWGLGQLEVVGR